MQAGVIGHFLRQYAILLSTLEYRDREGSPTGRGTIRIRTEANFHETDLLNSSVASRYRSDAARRREGLRR